MEDEIKSEVSRLQSSGLLQELHELLVPYVEQGNPFALHVRASFSLDQEESESEYSIRYVEQLTRASEGGVAEASYQMGVNYLNGDEVQQDYKLASMFFERAISQGHSYTKFTFGFSLYYGTDQNPKNEARGLALMQAAAIDGIDKASHELELIDASKNV